MNKCKFVVIIVKNKYTITENFSFYFCPLSNEQNLWMSDQ